MDPYYVRKGLILPADVKNPEARVVVRCDPAFQGRDSQIEDVVRLVGQRIGGQWIPNLRQRPVRIELTRKPTVPVRVNFHDVIPLLEAGEMLKPLLGLTYNGEPFYGDFGADFAHMAVSASTGAGKTMFLAWLIAWFYYHGCRDITITDNKLVSMTEFGALPGVELHIRVTDQWKALAALRLQMERDYETKLNNPDAVFPIRLIVMEEASMFAFASREYWDGLEDKPKDALRTPPVFRDIRKMLLLGREIGYHFISVYQKLTANSLGGSGADPTLMRDQYGMKALARYSWQEWDSLTGIKPRWTTERNPGRWHVVLGGDVAPVQVPFAEGKLGELVAYLKSGITDLTDETDDESDISGHDRQDGGAANAQVSQVSSVKCQEPGVVRGNVAAAKFVGMSNTAFRNTRRSRAIPGQWVEGRTPCYTEQALREWRAGE
jgi:hypothetical protein